MNTEREKALKILFYRWDSVIEEDIISAFQEWGNIVYAVSYPLSNYDRDAALENSMGEAIHKYEINIIFSVNYFPILAEVAKRQGILYICWTQDNPLFTLYSNTIYYNENYIFCFDYDQYLQLQKRGVKHCYYLPLAANVERVEQLLLEETSESTGYHCEVSFVGSLYTEQCKYDRVKYLPPYIKGYLDGLIQAQVHIYGYNFLEELIQREMEEEIKKYIEMEFPHNYHGTYQALLVDLLYQKCTAIERFTLLNAASKSSELFLYTSSNTTADMKAVYKGTVDYHTEMPRVFANSKINLNITSKSISSGLPLRIFDIMGAGGFLLTNYQKEIGLYFEDGKDCVVFQSEADLIEKIQYYLGNEEERLKIAQNGKRKIKELHSFTIRIGQILKQLGIE